MPMDRFFIGQYNAESGLQTNLKPFMLPDQAFAQMNNAYVFRGRARKRFGTRWFGNTMQSTRLRINLGNTDGAGAASGSVPSGSGAVGQMFSIGTELFTVSALGTPTIMLTTGAATTRTFNTTTGAYVFAGAAANTAVFWYPSLPVMGLLTYENNAVNNEPTIGFDTRYAYEYAAGIGWTRLAGEVTPGAATWTGSNADFFWGCTYVGVDAFNYVLFVTNFNKLEPNYMRFLFNNQWDNFRPALDGTGSLFLISARILVPFKNRLLAFNTWEGASTASQNQYANRMRYSALASPLAANAWQQDIPGKGGGLDCPSVEAIVTVEFVKDRLIVFLEESTWEIVYTGNQISPFAWQQINTELGAESTFSIVPFDKVAIGVGNVGIVACTGTNVERIDERIPDEVFKIHNTDSGTERVYGIRDYSTEMIYWAFPSVSQSATFPYPNRVLTYNYKNGCWAFNDDSFTVFGYFQPQTGITWDSTEVGWNDNTSWDSGSTSALFRQVIAGNQEGWTFIVDPEETVNAPSLQITALSVTDNIVTFTVIDHNLSVGDYIRITDITNAGGGNLTLLNGNIYQVQMLNPAEANRFTITYDTTPDVLTGTYTGGGLIARVSRIQILTKQYNFYRDKGRNAYVSKVDFLVDTTAHGEIGVDYYVSTNPVSMNEASSVDTGTGSLLGTGNLETFAYPTVPFEENSSQVWHPVYFQADGEFIQLDIALTDDQMRNEQIRQSPFEMHAMIFNCMPSSYRPQ